MVREDDCQSCGPVTYKKWTRYSSVLEAKSKKQASVINKLLGVNITIRNPSM